MTSLSLQRVSREYERGGAGGGRVRAVDGLSLDVAAGEVLVLLGPSGCGKTTTLRLIAGLDRPDAGTISIGDRDVRGVPPAKRGVALVFEQDALYPHLTARQNLAFAVRRRRWSKDEVARRIENMSHALGVRDVLDRRPGALSAGEQARVALGRGLLVEPAILLLDEPFGRLDAPRRRAIRNVFRRTRESSGATTVLVTHDQEEAIALADRLAVMAAGRVRQIGPPAEILTRPSSRFVAEFVSADPSNIREGRVEAAGSGRVWRATGADAMRPVADETPLGPGVELVRPADVTLVQDGGRVPAGNLALVRGVVISITSAGRESLVEIDAKTHGTWWARAATPTSFAPGGRVMVCASLDAVHIFEAGEHGGRVVGMG